MPQLVIPDIDDATLDHLRKRAAEHAQSTEAEARQILTSALVAPNADAWAVIDAIRQELAASGKDFGDSTELLREDRDR